jgi:predicted nucleic acid-binding protein
MEKGRQMIVVDTNVIIAMLITRGVTEEIISAHPDVFITPEHCYVEAWEHRDVWNRRRLDDDELKEIIEDVERLLVNSIPEGIYDDHLVQASKLISDPDDAPVVALALALKNDGIWTYDKKHFSTKALRGRVRILSTADVLTLYPIDE